MSAILASAGGLATYAIAISLGVGAAVSLAVVALVILVQPVVAAGVLGYRKPSWTSWLIQSSSAIVLLLAGCVAAAGIYGAAEAAGTSASGADKVMIGQLGAILAAIVLQVNGMLEAKLAPWFCWRVFVGYSGDFPAMPQGQGPGRDAWEACSTIGSFDQARWSRPALEQFPDDH